MAKTRTVFNPPIVPAKADKAEAKDLLTQYYERAEAINRANNGRPQDAQALPSRQPLFGRVYVTTAGMLHIEADLTGLIYQNLNGLVQTTTGEVHDSTTVKAVPHEPIELDFSTGLNMALRFGIRNISASLNLKMLGYHNLEQPEPAEVIEPAVEVNA